MQIFRVLIFGLLGAASIIQAQAFNMRKLNGDEGERLAASEQRQAELKGESEGESFNPANVPTSPIAEAITDAIQLLARDLENDPVRIFNYVHDHVRHVMYFGSKKGAHLTLLERSGNEFDQCALLVALLRAAGHTNCGYQFGWMELPYESADHKDLKHWLQLTLSNTNWNATSNYLDNLVCVYRGYPATATIWGTNTLGFQRIWVTLTNGTDVYYLDPAFKVHEPIPGLTNLAAAIGFSSNALMSAAGGTNTGDFVANLNEAALRSTLTGYTTNLLTYLRSNYPNASLAQILSGWQLVRSTNTTLSLELPFATYEWGGQMPVLNWRNQPTNLMSIFKISLPGTNFQCFMPELRGQRLTLTYDPYSVAQLWLEGVVVAEHYVYDDTVVVSVDHPIGYWNTNNNEFIDTSAYDQSSTNIYNIDGSFIYPPHFNAYNIAYCFEPDWRWLRERQDRLDYLRSLDDDEFSFEIQAETLNVMGLQFMLQSWHTEQLLTAQAGILPQNHHYIGRTAQEGANGYYFDFFMWWSGDFSAAGVHGINSNLVARVDGLISYFGSALEHGVIEQLQDSNYVAASTIKMLQIVNTNGQAVYLASSTNWATNFGVGYRLTGYTPNQVYNFTTLINSGHYLLLPAHGANWVDGYGSWSGYGLVDHQGPGSDGMMINGNFGGHVSEPLATVNPRYVSLVARAQPWRKPFRRFVTGADPVDLASGGFEVNQTDIFIGQPEPRGISISRYYNSVLRRANLAGMGPGWIHNYQVNAQSVPSPQANLGFTTPAQAAPMITATCVALGVYNVYQPNPKNWMVTALIAKWAVDQLNKKGVSVIMGKDTLQFVQQPDGTFTPPANCRWTLTKPSDYVLQERHGNTFNFDSLGRLSNIVNQYNQRLDLTYNASNRVSTVTDWKNRSFTFNYTGTPARLTSVTDNAGNRTIKYGYSAGGDLTSFTDPENKTNRFVYDDDHQLGAVIDARGQLVTTNLYDPCGYGRVNTQYAQGVTNKTWQVFWTGWETVVQDPAGGKQRYYYDDDRRLISQQNAMGHRDQTVYDGQDHIVMTVSPLDETNCFDFDSHHNLLCSVDELNFTNRLFYDAQHRLICTVNARGGTNRFGYNAQHSLTGSTNAAGDWTVLAYNANGTLFTKSDAGGTITNTYDGNGQLSRVTYPGGLGTEGFLNSSIGDVLSHTNARQFVTSFQYNKRRELTNSIAPTNVASRVTYDPVGNVQSTTDARGFTTTNAWSATRKLLITSLPATPQGVPVITNGYDARDWLVRTVDPLQKATLFTNDAAQRLISTTDPLNRTTRMGYDANGRNLGTTNAANEATRQQWNARGELTQTTTPANTTIKHSYDGAGNQLFLTNRNGRQWQFQFDAAKRLTNTITPTGKSTRRTYDTRGLLSTVREPSQQWTTNFYDPKGRLTNSVDGVANCVFRYNANDNVTNIVENGKTNSWTFDAYDRVSSYRDADGNLIQYGYDTAGNLTNLVYPGGRAVRYTYDSLNRLTNVTDWANRKTTFVYDLASRLTAIIRPNGTTRTNHYDAAGQVTNIMEKMSIGVPIAFYKFGWDDAGRVAWEFTAPLPLTNALSSRTMTFDDDNRLDTFEGTDVSHDDDGNLTYGPLTNSTFASYVYDARNRLVGTTSTSSLNYGYDPAGNRVGLTNGGVATRFVVNPNAPLSQVLMRVRNGVTSYYIHGLGLLYEITETATSTNTLTYHFDYRGSTVALTKDNGIITGDRIHYSAYGSITYRSGTNDTPFLYNGRYGVQTDANGLLYMRARYYNPYLCRFVNADPSGFEGGLNFYAYADGNPISMIDPFGLGAIGESSGTSWLFTPNAAQSEAASQSLIREQAMRSLGYAALGLNFNPEVYQLPEPSSASILLLAMPGPKFLQGSVARTPSSLLPVKYDPVFALEQGANPTTAVPNIYSVVRGGQGAMPAPGTVFSGSMGSTVAEAAAGVPNGTIRATTAGAIRSQGGSVVLVPEGTPLNLRHVNVLEGGNTTVFSETINNPVPKAQRWQKAR